MITPPHPATGALEFLCLYSRFEYALKRARFLKSQARRRKVTLANGKEGSFIQADPDWVKFAGRPSVQRKLESLANSDAAQYLRNSPPKIQIAVPAGQEHSLQWAKPIWNKNDLPFLLGAVQQVRNNLFHDGKWPTNDKDASDQFDDGPILAGRDPELIKAARFILEALIEADPDVHEQFIEHAEH